MGNTTDKRDEQIVRAVLAAHPSEDQRKALLRDVGPYEVTEPRPFTRELVRQFSSLSANPPIMAAQDCGACEGCIETCARLENECPRLVTPSSTRHSQLADELEALDRAATPAPWAWDQRGEKVNEWGMGV